MIGVLGGGQLGRMMAQAGAPGDQFIFLDPAPDACAGEFGELLTAAWDDSAALDTIAERADAVTFDFENVPEASAERVAAQTAFYPSPAALAGCQDRMVEKRLIRSLDIPTPDFHPVRERPDLLEGLERTGYPAVMKTRRFGYDGKGQFVLRGPEDLERAWQALGGNDLILEQFVPFDSECSIIGVRAADGEIRFWPVTRNVHRNGILAASLAPAADAALQQQAESLGARLLEHFGYVGVLALELFRVGDQLIANEIAPRVHNSGHWTIDGAVTSQFANHVNAVTGRPLGDTTAKHHSLMLNWIGRVPERVQLTGVHWHDYAKAPREGRKVGHATVVGDDMAQLGERAMALAEHVGGWALDVVPGLVTA